MDINLINLVFDYLPIEHVVLSFDKCFDSICDKYTIRKYKLSVFEIRKKYCQDINCKDKLLDETSIKTGYCEEHIMYHKCADCYRIKSKLNCVPACPERRCCDKFVCEEKCIGLACSICREYYELYELYRKIDQNYIICVECYTNINQNEKNTFNHAIKWNNNQTLEEISNSLR